MAQQVWKQAIRLKDNFCLNDLLTKSSHTKIQTYKVEERTFGTPCRTSAQKINLSWTVLFAALEPSDKNNTIYEIEDFKYEV